MLSLLVLMILALSLEFQMLDIAVCALYQCRGMGSSTAHHPSALTIFRRKAIFRAYRHHYHRTIAKLNWSGNESFYFKRIMVVTGEYVGLVLARLVSFSGDNILDRVSEEWRNFKVTLETIHEPLKFMQGSSPPLLSLMEQGVSLWTRMMRNDQLKSKLVREVSNLMQFNRGGPLHTRFIQDRAPYIKMLKDLSRDAYREFFEDIYIERAVLFYSWCSNNSRANGVCAYLQTVEIRLNNDIASASKVLPDSETVEKLGIVLRNEMIHKHLCYILGGLDRILREMVTLWLTTDVQSSCSDDLKRMWRLFEDAPFWIQSMCDAIDRIDLHEIATDLIQDERVRFRGIDILPEKLVHLEWELRGQPRLQMAVASARLRLLSSSDANESD